MLPSPLWLSSPPRGSTLSHLAGVGGQPLAMGLGRSVRCPRYRARSNQAPASLPSPSACSGRRDWAGGDCGWLPARHVLSLTWPASAVSHLPMAMDVQSGLLAVVSDQTRPQRRCRCHRRAAGGRSWAGTDHGWYSRRVVILEGLVPWHWPSLVRVQLGRRRSGGSPASRGFAGLGDTGLSAARLRAGTTVDAVSAVPAVTWSGPDRAREPRWAAPDQTHPPHPASGPLTSGRRSANGLAAGRRHRTPRHGLGRGPRADRVTRRCLRSRVDSLPAWFCARQMPAVPRA